MIGEPMSEQSWRSSDESHSDAPRFACDAMCGGLARWLRAYGYDTSYTEGIADLDLVRTAQSESRILISSDGPLFERRLIRDRIVGSYRLERGLKLLEQFRHIVREFRLLRGRPGAPFATVFWAWWRASTWPIECPPEACSGPPSLINAASAKKCTGTGATGAAFSACEKAWH